MVQDGEVALSDPVEKYLPKTVHVPAFGTKKITLLSLATQHSGLPRLPANLDPSVADPYATYTVEKLYAFLNSYKLTRAPGATFEYSNLGVGLLGIALANRAHLSYEALLQRRVLQPLGMTSTTTLRTPETIAKLAIGHDADGNAAHYWNFSAIAPAGAIVSSVDDMLKYLDCNLGHGPLAKACLFAQMPRADFPGHHIGLVWWIDDKTGIIEHGGDTYAFHAGVAIAPDRRAAAVALTNGGAGAEDVALNAIDPSQPLAFPERSLKLDAMALAAYVGTYNGVGAAAGVPYVFAAGDGYLTASLGPQPAAKAYPVAPDTFSYRVVAANLKFVRADDGAVIGVRLYQGGKTATFVRGDSDAAKRLASATPTPLPAPLALESAKLSEYAGTYRTAAGLAFAVVASGTTLTVQLASQPAFPLFAASDDHFYLKVVDAQIDFARDASGKVSSLTLHQNGRDIVAPRVQ
jgi:CubicO group peptidase (beta-lactamase class C family)